MIDILQEIAEYLPRRDVDNLRLTSREASYRIGYPTNPIIPDFLGSLKIDLWSAYVYLHMSFSAILTHNWYACESASVDIGNGCVIISGEDPSSIMRHEIFLPGLHFMICDDYMIIKEDLTDEISTFQAIYGEYKHKGNLQASIIKALPVINENIAARDGSILPGVIMNGRINLGRGTDRRLRGMNVLFTVTYGDYLQAVTNTRRVYMFTSDGHGDSIAILDSREMDELMMKVRERAPKMKMPGASYADIDLVTFE